MKKNLFVPAVVMAVLCTPLFANEKIGKVTGIQVNGENAVLTIEEGAVNPFSEDGFIATNGTFTQTVPLTTLVEFNRPQRKNPPADRRDSARVEKDAREGRMGEAPRERGNERLQENAPFGKREPKEGGKNEDFKQNKKERRAETPERPRPLADERQEPPFRSVKQLHIDQLICLVYNEDGSTVEKILVQPEPQR